MAGSGLTWTNVWRPEPSELAELVRECDVTTTDAEFLVQDHHRPEVAIRDTYMLLLIHVPTFDRKNRITRGTSLYLIIRDNHIWTVHHEDLVTLQKLFEQYQVAADLREEYFGDGALTLALSIISHMYASAFRKLERLAKHIDIAENAVFQGNERKMVEEISMLTRDVMDFRKVIRLQTGLFTVLPDHSLLTTSAYQHWSRLHNQTLKLWDILEGLYETVTELSSTNSSLLQYKENELLRLLSVYSVVVIPLLVIVPIFNPGAPDATTGDLIAFGIIVTILIITLGLIFIRSKRKLIL